jgi:hypothetical protein
MSGWELATLASIAVLVLGSLAVFVWFLFDAVRWLREHPSRRKKRGDVGPSERGGSDAEGADPGTDVPRPPGK